jgi:hypothetical protein
MYAVNSQAMPVMMVVQQPAQQNGIITVHYLSASCCCCACCCSCLGSQRQSNKDFNILIDNNKMGKLSQGISSQWTVPAGNHQVSIQYAGMTGFIKGLVGTNDVSTVCCAIQPNQMTTLEIGWSHVLCSNDNHDKPFIRIV